MATAGHVEDPDNPRVYSESAKEWMRKKAAAPRQREISNETRLDYSQIVFPPLDRCRHAALVVCAAAKDAADAKILLDALALPTILREGGGDGRVLRVQKGPVRIGDPEDLPPVGYGGGDEVGRPERKPKKTGLNRASDYKRIRRAHLSD